MMMTGCRFKYFLSVLLIFQSIFLFSQNIPDKPNPPRLVNDYAGILTQKQISNLEKTLRIFNDTTSNQIVIVTVKSLHGYSPALFATELGHKWGVGQKKFDNGIVVLVKPKYGNERGKAFIAVGYGLEPVITDALSKRIVEKEMIPYFKQGDYYGGLLSAVNVLMKLASGEISEKTYYKQSQGGWFTALLPFLVILLIFLLIRGSNARSYSIGTGRSFWTAFFLGSMLGGGSHRGHWNDFSGGGGSNFGGFGGGGSFGGFGGGGFGGGGAGGSW